MGPIEGDFEGPVGHGVRVSISPVLESKYREMLTLTPRPIVSNRRWHWRNLVLLDDALRTGHPSVGSGTRLAMQDAIALFEACVAHADVPALRAAFEHRRRPASDALEDAAIKSAQWYETLGARLSLDPVSFACDYALRAGSS